MVKSVSTGNADMQMSQHRNVNKLSNDHETINEKLDKLLDMFGEKMLEDNIKSVTETVNQLEVSVATIQKDISLLQESVLNINTKALQNRLELDQQKQERGDLSALRGTTYIRWGRTECPGNGSDLVYQGFAGGSWYQHTGAASSLLCLPKEPTWAKFDDTVQTYGGYIYGTEYRDSMRAKKLNQKDTYKHNVPCAVCSIIRRPVSIMIPARIGCYPGWTLEYRGYLMSGRYDHAAATDHYCVDASPEMVSGGSADQLGNLLYFVESRCGSLQCPPYKNGRELACAVCSK